MAGETERRRVRFLTRDTELLRIVFVLRRSRDLERDLRRSLAPGNGLYCARGGESRPPGRGRLSVGVFIVYYGVANSDLGKVARNSRHNFCVSPDDIARSLIIASGLLRYFSCVICLCWTYNFSISRCASE